MKREIHAEYVWPHENLKAMQTVIKREAESRRLSEFNSSVSIGRQNENPVNNDQKSPNPKEVSIKKTIVSEVPPANRDNAGGKMKICSICLGQHKAWDSICEFNRGKSKQAVSMVEKNGNCPRCLRNKAVCIKYNNCNGKAVNRRTNELFITDCKNGCTHNSLPINVVLCGCKTDKNEEINVMNVRVNQTAPGDEKTIGLSMAEYVTCMNPGKANCEKVGLLYDPGATDCIVKKSPWSQSLPEIKREGEVKLNLAIGSTKITNPTWRLVTIRGKTGLLYEVEALEIESDNFGGWNYCGNKPTKGKHSDLFKKHNSEVYTSLVIGQKASDCFPRLVERGNNRLKLPDTYQSIFTYNGILGGCQEAPNLFKYVNTVGARKISIFPTLVKIEPLQMNVAKVKRSDDVIICDKSRMNTRDSVEIFPARKPLQGDKNLLTAAKCQTENKPDNDEVDIVNTVDKKCTVGICPTKPEAIELPCQNPDKYPLPKPEIKFGYDNSWEGLNIVPPIGFRAENFAFLEGIFETAARANGFETPPQSFVPNENISPPLSDTLVCSSHVCHMSLKILVANDTLNVERISKFANLLNEMQVFLRVGQIRNLGCIRIMTEPPDALRDDGPGRLNWWPYDDGWAQYQEEVEPCKTTDKAGKSTVENRT